VVERKERALVLTLTKRMAENLSEYLENMNIRVRYLHSEIQALDRVEILRDLRLAQFDVLVGINLLREGLDLPEVSLVAILDADKEGYLRSKGALIQTMGRAARHIEGKVIMYADIVTLSMKEAIDEINRRRKIQEDYNEEHGITPKGIIKAVRDITERIKAEAVAEKREAYNAEKPLTRDGVTRLVKELEGQMKQAAKAMEFEKAALIRDRIIELRKELVIEDAQITRAKGTRQ